MEFHKSYREHPGRVSSAPKGNRYTKTIQLTPSCIKTDLAHTEQYANSCRGEICKINLAGLLCTTRPTQSLMLSLTRKFVSNLTRKIVSNLRQCYDGDVDTESYISASSSSVADASTSLSICSITDPASYAGRSLTDQEKFQLLTSSVDLHNRYRLLVVDLVLVGCLQDPGYVTALAYIVASEPRPSPLRIYGRVINCAWVNTLKAGKAWANTSREGRRWVDAGSRAPLTG